MKNVSFTEKTKWTFWPTQYTKDKVWSHLYVESARPCIFESAKGVNLKSSDHKKTVIMCDEGH